MRGYSFSIRTELVLALVLVGTLAATFVVIFFPARQATSTRTLLDRTAANLAVVTGRSNSAALEFDDPESATASLRDLSAHPDVEFAVILDSSGRVFAKYTRRALELSPLIELLRDRESVGVTAVWRNYRVGIWSVRSGAEKLGTVAVGFTTAHIDSLIRANRSVAIVVGFGLLLCLSVFGIALGQVVGGPIRDTATIMQEIASDDSTLQVRLASTGGERLRREAPQRLWPREIIALRESFLDMLRRLAQSRRALEELTSSLEERVRERTVELEQRDRTLEGRNAELKSKASILVSRNAALEQARQVLDKQRTDLEAANAELEKASRLKSEFLANMSHEIRTPLNGIAGFIELALDNAGLSREQREYLEIAHRSTETLTSLINDILDFSKIEAGRLELERVDFLLPTLVRSIEELLSVRASSKGLAFLVDVSPDVPSMLKGDPTRIRQILVNLIGNAIKFTEHGHVAVRVQSEGVTDGREWVRFSVCDTGIGIPPEKESQIFESFRQADGSTTRKYGGTGLGLAISRKLVEQMGGEIGVESVIGLGSTFWFKVPLQRASVKSKSAGASASTAPTLPVAKPMVSRQTEAPVPSAPADASRKLSGRILVAEDNPVNRKLVLTILGKRGYTVDTATNGKEAVKAVLSRSYAVVLMDVQMPEMDGLEATRRIREEEGARKHTPIVTMTAHAMKGDRERCLAAGADDYLSKPVRADRLLECVRYWSERQAEEKGGSDMEVVKAETREPVDVERLSECTAGDEELALELAALFLEATPPQLESLRGALEAGDATTAAEISHTMKGSCGSLGATPLEDLCREIEVETARSSLDTAKQLLHRAEEEFQRVRQFVDRMKELAEAATEAGVG